MTTEQTQIYNLGKWFITVAKLQVDANPGRNNLWEGTVLKDVNALHTNTPTTYIKYRKLVDYYLGKLNRLGKSGASVWYDKILTELSSTFPTKFNTRLTRDQIGFFYIGMDDQKTFLFTKKENGLAEENN